MRLAISETEMIGDTLEADIPGGGRADGLELAKPALSLESLFPSVNRDNDTPLDLQEWVRRNREAV